MSLTVLSCIAPDKQISMRFHSSVVSINGNARGLSNTLFSNTINNPGMPSKYLKFDSFFACVISSPSSVNTSDGGRGMLTLGQAFKAISTLHPVMYPDLLTLPPTPFANTPVHGPQFQGSKCQNLTPPKSKTVAHFVSYSCPNPKEKSLGNLGKGSHSRFKEFCV